MKKEFDWILMSLLICIEIYLIISFVVWNWNPLNWSLLGRFIAVALMIIIEGFVVLSSDE